MSSDVSTSELRAMLQRYKLMRDKHESLDREAKEIWEEVKILERQILNVMDANKLERFDSEDASFTRSTRTSVKMPKEPTQREAFFDYLRGHGVFEDMVTINHQSLNSWFKKEAEAKGLENPWELQVPGLESETSNYITMRRK